MLHTVESVVRIESAIAWVHGPLVVIVVAEEPSVTLVISTCVNLRILRNAVPLGYRSTRSEFPVVPSLVDDQLLMAHDQALVKMRREVGTQFERPIPPGFGTLGWPGTPLANYFAMKIANPFVYEYDVRVRPHGRVKDVYRRLIELLDHTNNQAWDSLKSSVAHNGADKLISAKELSQPLQMSIKFFEEGQTPGPNSTEYSLTVSGILMNSRSKYKQPEMLCCFTLFQVSEL